MSDTSAILGLPYLMPSQAQKHVTHNEALALLDVIVQLRVLDFGAETPPADPDAGAVYALGAAPVDAWAGQAGTLAAWDGTAWSFVAPKTGWRAGDAATGALRLWDGSDWTVLTGNALSQNRLGINTTADTTNRLSVSSDAVLLNHDGGDSRVKVNKAAAGDTASLLFQSGFTGHAEMGLAGGIDFAIRVSADGAAWRDALSVDAGQGNVGVNTTAPAARLDVAGDARVRTAGGAFSGAVLSLETARAASAGFDFLRCASDDGADTAFRLAGDGDGHCDGAWIGGGADYAEWFEWADGNPQDEDRRGVSVVLAEGRIRPAVAGEDPIGIVSAAPCLVGDADGGRWHGKFARDAYGGYLRDALGARVLSREFDPARPYLPRAERREWAMVGLVGKLRLREGQPTGARWLRLAPATESAAEQWLVR